MMDYKKITLRGIISEKAKWHKRKFRSQCFTTFTVKVTDQQGKSTFFPIVAYGQAAKSAGMKFRVGLRIMIVGEVRQDTKGDTIIIPKYWRYGHLASSR